jgi:hypothetical protein
MFIVFFIIFPYGFYLHNLFTVFFTIYLPVYQIGKVLETIYK